MKKAFSILLVAAIGLCSTLMVSASWLFPEQNRHIFTDVPEDHWAFSAIRELAAQGIISGYADGTYRPDDAVSRAEWAKLMIESAGIHAGDYGAYFSDTADHWARRYINAASGHMPGYGDGSYKPDEDAVREDVAVSIVSIMGFETAGADFSYLDRFIDSIGISEIAKPYVAVAVEQGLISGFEDGTFMAQSTLSRAQAAVLLWRAFPVDFVDNVIPSRGGSVAVSSSTDFSFVPNVSAVWEIYTADSYYSDPYLIIYDQVGDIVAEDDDAGGYLNARVLVRLTEGIEYTISAGFFYGSEGEFILYVAPLEIAEFLSGSGEVRVNGEGFFEFSPDSTGLWILETSDSGNSDPMLLMYDNSGDLIHYNDDMAGLDSAILGYFYEGDTYLVNARFYTSDIGSCLLTYSPLVPDSVIPGSGGDAETIDVSYHEFTPDRSGLWLISYDDFGAGGVYSWIDLLDSHGISIDYSWRRIVAYLDAGETYYINAGIMSYDYWDYWYWYDDYYEEDFIDFDDDESVTDDAASYVFSVSPISISGSLPTSGGEVDVSSDSFYEFVPESSGFWTLFTSDNGDSDPVLWFYSSNGRLIDWNDDNYVDFNSRLIVLLEEGETYYVNASFYGDDEVSYVLNVAPPLSLPSNGGEIYVAGDTIFEFTPEQTGVWEFRTLSDGDQDPLLELMDEFTYYMAYADDNAGGRDAILSIYLEAGRTYYLLVEFWWSDDGGTTLRISFRP